MPMKLVIFDCDGTIVDSQHMICSAAMRAAGAAPHDTVVVGDTVYDIAMARAAGAAAIGVAWGYHSRDALAATGAAMIDSFATLEPALDKIWTL